MVVAKTQYYTATSIDGFIADQGNSPEWPFQAVPSSGKEDRFSRFFTKVGAMPEHQQLSGLRRVAAEHRVATPRTRHVSRYTILSSTRPANHHRDRPAGDSAGQPRDRVFERHRITSGAAHVFGLGFLAADGCRLGLRRLLTVA
jgi:hypothetical protein